MLQKRLFSMEAEQSKQMELLRSFVGQKSGDGVESIPNTDIITFNEGDHPQQQQQYQQYQQYGYDSKSAASPGPAAASPSRRAYFYPATGGTPDGGGGSSQ